MYYENLLPKTTCYAFLIQPSRERRALKKNRLFICLLVSLAYLLSFPAMAQRPWHGIERYIHYKPEGEDFVLVNGNKRFNRALYGTNTAFRVETGDLPEFALYMPGMGGNFKMGIIAGNESKWLTHAAKIETRYRPGSMLYTIQDPMLGNGALQLTVLALADGEGMIIRTQYKGDRKDIQLLCVFGGATGKKFSRDGDIGADPESSFYLKPEYCTGNTFALTGNIFRLSYGKDRRISGVFPPDAKMQLADANAQLSPIALINATADKQPVVTGTLMLLANKEDFFLVQAAADGHTDSYTSLASRFTTAENARKKLSNRIKVNTPDPFINTLGGALSVAADGIWESPTFLHGAVAWRMRLNAWRGAYVADPLGWSDRARLHFTSYGNSQVLTPETAPVAMDTFLHLARHKEKMGNALFSSGYISRNPNDNTKPHHYDMNLVFFDQLFTHFQYTGDLHFIREMWPVIKRHLAWEKRNFDKDGDGLYDAYAAIWASDALQYSGGGVMHSSAYNYRSNRIAAQLAKLLGEDPLPYQQEADKILKAIRTHLWLPQQGWYAEYKDLLGLQLQHTAPGLWTIYHAIDSDVPDAFQAYQSLRYIDNEIPHIPVAAKGLPYNDLYTLATTNWQPYDWSLNNVALAEVLHTALAYWQGGRPEDAYKLWAGNIIETMYLGSSPGGFEQLSFYDAMRGELYRDFADPIGMAARTLVEGLYGIKPDALIDTLTIKPGFPSTWDHASLQTPAISFSFRRKHKTDTYILTQTSDKHLFLRLVLPVFKDHVQAVTLNGKKTNWRPVEGAVGQPWMEILADKLPRYEIRIEWKGARPDTLHSIQLIHGEAIQPVFDKARLLTINDPQGDLSHSVAYRYDSLPYKAVFCNVKQGDFTWWLPLHITLTDQVQLLTTQEQKEGLTLQLKNNGARITGQLTVNKRKAMSITLDAHTTKTIDVPAQYIASGTNNICFEYDSSKVQQAVITWGRLNTHSQYEKVDISRYFNDAISNIFKHAYLSPRPEGPTLQLPWQGIGNWCYPLVTANIDDSGLRTAAGKLNEIRLPNGVPLSTPGDTTEKNIAFTSRWDNYPDSLSIPLTGKATHAYLLMAGTTNPMQTRMDNGEVLFYYSDGTYERLVLRNPETWWPIEQDYFTDGAAFTTNYPKPYRLHFKSGEISRDFKQFTTIKGFSNFAVDGGAGTVLDLALDPTKELKEVRLKTLCNDVITGLMSLTLAK